MNRLKSFLQSIDLKYLGGDHNIINVQEGIIIARVLINDDGSITTNGLSHNKQKLLETYTKLSKMGDDVLNAWLESR